MSTTNSVKLSVEIEYRFQWQNAYPKEKIEVFACDILVCTVDKYRTSNANTNIPCPLSISRLARQWAGWTATEAQKCNDIAGPATLQPTAEEQMKRYRLLEQAALILEQEGGVLRHLIHERIKPFAKRYTTWQVEVELLREQNPNVWPAPPDNS